MDNEASLARVDPGQPYLPGLGRTVQEVCGEIGLQWFAALNLAAEGYFSFHPDRIVELDSSQEAEITFVGTLSIWANDRVLLDRLLCGLRKPYCYNLARIWYDWRDAKWREFPEQEEQDEQDQEEALADWLAALVADGDTSQLQAIQDQVEDAIRQAGLGGRMP